MSATERRPRPSADDATDEWSLANQLGLYLAKLATGGDLDLLRRTITLLCQENGQGHVCVALAEWQGRVLQDGDVPFPAAAAWQTALLATGLCHLATAAAPDDTGDTGAAPRLPLVLDARARLYLLRHYRNEQRLLAFLRLRLRAPAMTSAATLHQALQELDLLPAADAIPDWQLAAVAAAVHRSLAIVCGGPGTGKTTTVARVLAVLQHLHPGLRVALAAPTGKAAARLGEALRQRAAQAGTPAANPAAAIEPKTLHRLLGYLPLDDAFRAGPDQPIPYDVVVVDEASMVDPAVLAVLCSALRPEARLILVGDQDQLAAVAAGQVLGDLCRSARPELGVGTELAAFVTAATGMPLPVQENAPAIANATIALRTNHRFAGQPGIGSFAEALSRRDHEAAMAALAAGHQDLQRVADAEQALAAVEATIVDVATAQEPSDALARLGRVRILAATRHGPNGALAWNRRVEAMLARRGAIGPGTWYHGRQILITANDPQNQLWNGDLGVVLRSPDGRALAWFVGRDGAPRSIVPLRLPPHETAWAMTVHKAQGSEFDEVLLVLPDRPGPLWQASLVYTGITRARRRATLLADPTLLAQCLAHWPVRSSGLTDGLQDLRP